MSEPPIIYLTNVATVNGVQRGVGSEASKACVGPGPHFTIMRFPRRGIGEAGHGHILAFTPPKDLAAPAIKAKKETDAGQDSADEWRAYEEALRARWMRARELHRPGRLAWCLPTSGHDPDAARWDGGFWVRQGVVESGATLVCACSRKAAADGRCHRVIAAELLADAGWRVVLDGVEL